MNPLAALLVGVATISFSAILVRAAGVDPVVAALQRCAWALPVLALLTWRSPGRGARGIALIAGALLAIDLIAWHIAIGRIGAGLATVLANTQVLFVAAIGALFLHQRIGARTAGAIAIVLCGIALIGGVGSGQADVAVTGILLGVLAAATYAGFLLLYEQAGRVSGSLPSTLLWATTGAAAVCALAVAARGTSPLVSWEATGWLVLLALSSQVAGWLLVARGLGGMGTLAASVLLLLQPVCTTIWGVLLLGEDIEPSQALGIAVVLVGVGLARSAMPSAGATIPE